MKAFTFDSSPPETTTAQQQKEKQAAAQKEADKRKVIQQEELRRQQPSLQSQQRSPVSDLASVVDMEAIEASTGIDRLGIYSIYKPVYS